MALACVRLTENHPAQPTNPLLSGKTHCLLSWVQNNICKGRVEKYVFYYAMFNNERYCHQTSTDIILLVSVPKESELHLGQVATFN